MVSIFVTSPLAPIICVKNETQHSGPHCGWLLRRLIAVIKVDIYCTEKNNENSTLRCWENTHDNEKVRSAVLNYLKLAHIFSF